MPPREAWQIGRISGVAEDKGGFIYLLQRGDNADPVVVLDRDGRVVREWGKGLYVVPHSIRIDPQGNVWTTDASTSLVRKFSSQGQLLQTLEIGNVPTACGWQTRGATDVAFAPNGHVFVADGYTNERIIEYSADGQKLKEWGARGAGRGEFVLPHSVVIDAAGVLHVADRENGRIQRFDLDGRWLGESVVGGKPFTLAVTEHGILADVSTVDAAKSARPNLVQLDRQGVIRGRMTMPGGHGMSVSSDGKRVVVPSGTKLYAVSVSQ